MIKTPAIEYREHNIEVLESEIGGGLDTERDETKTTSEDKNRRWYHLGEEEEKAKTQTDVLNQPTHESQRRQ